MPLNSFDKRYCPHECLRIQNTSSSQPSRSLIILCNSYAPPNLTIQPIQFNPTIQQQLHYLQPMGFQKFVEVGRVARINFGSQEGKLAVIVDIINENRVLIDGAHVQRQVIPVRRLRLTNFIVKIGRGARTGSVRKALETEQLQSKWDQSASGKRLAAQQKRSNLNDFERFKVSVLRKRLSKLLRIRPKTVATKSAPVAETKAPAVKTAKKAAK